MSYRSTVSSIVVLGAAMAATACSTTDNARTATAGSSAARVPIGAQAAVLRTFFAGNASAVQQGAAAYCVRTKAGTQTGDPDPALFAALRDEPRVKPASACEAPATGGPVIEKASGKAALFFDVEPIRCEPADNCLVSASYYEANMSAQQNLYRARRVNGEWVVTLEQPGPIS